MEPGTFTALLNNEPFGISEQAMFGRDHALNKADALPGYETGFNMTVIVGQPYLENQIIFVCARTYNVFICKIQA